MNSLLEYLEKINEITFKIEKWVLFMAVVSMIAINFMQVLCRYIFKYSIPWSEQASIALFMLMVLLGGNLAMKEDQEIKIEIIRFKNEAKDLLFRLSADIISLITLVFLVVSTALLIQQSGKRPQVLSALPIEYYHLFMVMLFGFCLMLIEKFTNIVKKVVAIKNRKNAEDVTKL